MGITTTSSTMPVPQEAPNFDEVSMQQSLLFSDTLMVLLLLFALLSICDQACKLFQSSQRLDFRWCAFSFLGAWICCSLSNLARSLVFIKLGLFNLNCCNSFFSYHMVIQDLKNLRTQLYSAAEYFELSYTIDDHKQMWVNLIHYCLYFEVAFPLYSFSC